MAISRVEYKPSIYDVARKETGMIAFLEGTVEEKTADSLTLNVGGVGFLVRTNVNTLSRAGQRGERFRVLTTLIVREDAMELFGFATREESEMFTRLTGISGIGPRTAQGLLSALTPADIAIAVMTGDAKALARAPGIGPKTAQRMILELKDKVGQEDLAGGGTVTADVASGPVQEAILALMALGYTSAEAAAAAQAVRSQADKPDQLVLLALRKLGGA